jgi:excisionase family DNA binding protein
MWKNIITIKSAAEILGVSEQTLRNWDKQGKLKARRDAETGFRVYKISELESFAAKTKINCQKKKARLGN